MTDDSNATGDPDDGENVDVEVLGPATRPRSRDRLPATRPAIPRPRGRPFSNSRKRLGKQGL